MISHQKKLQLEVPFPELIPSKFKHPRDFEQKPTPSTPRRIPKITFNPSQLLSYALKATQISKIDPFHKIVIHFNCLFYLIKDRV